MTAGPARLFPMLLGLAVAVAASVSAAPAAAAPAAVKKIEALNGKAISAYEAGDSKKAEGLLQEAVVLAKQKGLATHTSVARTYLTLGLILIDGLAEEERGERYFALALRIDPSIKMKATANEAVAAAFERAQVQAAKDREKEAALAKEAEGAETAGIEADAGEAEAADAWSQRHGAAGAGARGARSGAQAEADEAGLREGDARSGGAGQGRAGADPGRADGEPGRRPQGAGGEVEAVHRAHAAGVREGRAAAPS